MGRKRATESKITTTVQFTNTFLDFIRSECDATGMSIGLYLETMALGSLENQNLALAQKSVNEIEIEINKSEQELLLIQTKLNRLKQNLNEKETILAKSKMEFENSTDFVLGQCCDRAIPKEIALDKLINLGILAISPRKDYWIGHFELINWIGRITEEGTCSREEAIAYIKQRPMIKLSKLEISKLVAIFSSLKDLSFGQWHTQLDFALFELDGSIGTDHRKTIIGPIWPK